MFFSRYPRTKLVHTRVLQCFGRERGLSILPVPGPPVEPPEVIHQHSAVVHSLEPGIVYVVEWTGDQVELHHVRL
ncbi:hypothetical protein D0Z08_19585 [Nocardioides immobilis]|uniref:Uncharacterized protein n=1 Tax=Nocardioides immobilis TaxID=2049295 RepID=A0A417XYI7_9ACTN|nr:hypothetical protein D0Z08_19585 [Nocardioides immobilis]